MNQFSLPRLSSNRRDFSVLVKILTCNRWKDYSNLLSFAIRHRYKLCSIHEAIENSNQQPFIILRHDVDHKGAGINRILDIEKGLNIHSSWYFRWETADRKLMREINDSGSEVGLHFETLATVCKKHNIIKRAAIYPEIIDEARELLKREINDFRALYHIPCRTIASHGHRINREVEMANNEIIDSDFYKDSNIVIEAYDPRLLDRIDCYISDDSLLHNFGWAYGITLKSAIKLGHRRICFLSHPHHWEFSLKRRIHLSIQWLKTGVSISDKQFKPTY